MQEKLPIPTIVNLYASALTLLENDPEIKAAPESSRKDTEKPIVQKQEIVENENQPYWLGGNNKNILIVISNSNQKFLADKEMELLAKILSACHYNLEDVAIVNEVHTPKSLREMWNDLNFKYVILFNVDPAAVNLKLPLQPYLIHRQGGLSYLLAGALEAMILNTPESKQQKMKLWNGLQEIFGIK